MKQYSIEITFQEVDGLWVAIDSASQTPPTLADTLSQLDIVINDNTEFCQIIRYKNNVKQRIVYRMYGEKILLNITQNKEQ